MCYKDSVVSPSYLNLLNSHVFTPYAFFFLSYCCVLRAFLLCLHSCLITEYIISELDRKLCTAVSCYLEIVKLKNRGNN